MGRVGRAGALSRTVGIEGRARKPAVCGGPLCQLCPGTARPSPPGLASLGPVPWCPQTHQGERGLGSRTLFPRARWSAGYWPATATLELPRGQTQEQGPPWVGLRTQCHQRRSQDLTCVQGCGSQGHAGPVRLGQRTAAARTEDLFTQLRTQTRGGQELGRGAGGHGSQEQPGDPPIAGEGHLSSSGPDVQAADPLSLAVRVRGQRTFT